MYLFCHMFETRLLTISLDTPVCLQQCLFPMKYWTNIRKIIVNETNICVVFKCRQISYKLKCLVYFPFLKTFRIISIAKLNEGHQIMCISIKTWVAVHRELKLNLQIVLTQENLPQSAEDGDSRFLPAADPETSLIPPPTPLLLSFHQP